MPSAASSLRRSRKIPDWSPTSSRTRSRAAASCSAGVRPSGEPSDRPGFDLLAKSGDPDLEELVEVAREDREEPGSLQERIPLVAGLVEDAVVEVQPGQFAVQVGERGSGPRGASRAVRDGSGWGSGIDGGHLGGGAPRAGWMAGEDSTAR